VDLLTPARDNLRLYEHRRAVDEWLNALVTDYKRTLMDDLGDEVLFMDDEFVGLENGGPIVQEDHIPAMQSGLDATVAFLRGPEAVPTPEQQKALIDGLAEALSEFADAPMPKQFTTAEEAAAAAPPEPPKPKSLFDLSIMPKVEGLKRVVVHTGGKASAKKGAAWVKKHKRHAETVLTAWATAVRAVARMMDVQVDAVGFCFGEDLAAEYLRVRNGRWAVMINPTKLKMDDEFLADEILDCAMHEITHHLRGMQHDEAWVLQEIKVRRKCRPQFVRGTVARALSTKQLESVDEWLATLAPAAAES
jgi:hypothetical protein